MFRTILSVAVLVTAVGALGLLSRASDRPGGDAPTRAQPHVLTDPVDSLPAASPEEGVVEEPSVYLEEPGGSPLSIEQEFLTIERDLHARDESCRIAEEILREGDLHGLQALFSAYARTRDPRVRAGVLKAVRRSKPPSAGLHWSWLESCCPGGAEVVAAAVGIRVGLGRHGACFWLARTEEVKAQRGLIDAILEGLSQKEAAELADWCSRGQMTPGIERLLEVLEE